VKGDKLLRVKTGYFQAGAVWRKVYGVWSCVNAARTIRWMVGWPARRVEVALLKMGADWEWEETRR
jgi:hypothetical protein